MKRPLLMVALACAILAATGCGGPLSSETQRAIESQDIKQQQIDPESSGDVSVPQPEPSIVDIPLPVSPVILAPDLETEKEPTPVTIEPIQETEPETVNGDGYEHITDEQYWEALAECVRHRHGLYESTAQLIDYAIETVDDSSRLGSWNQHPEPITDKNRDYVIGVILGTEKAPESPPSPIIVSQLHVFIMCERTGGETDDIKQARLWSIRNAPMRWLIVDDDTPESDRVNWPEWGRDAFAVAEAMRAEAVDNPDNVPWYIVASPTGGESSRFSTFKEFEYVAGSYAD